MIFALNANLFALTNYIILTGQVQHAKKGVIVISIIVAIIDVIYLPVPNLKSLQTLNVNAKASELCSYESARVVSKEENKPKQDQHLKENV